MENLLVLLDGGVNLDLGTIITLVIGVLTTFFGGAWIVVKKKLSQVVQLGKETYELIDKVEKVLDDNKVTETELKEVKKEAQDVAAAWKVLVKKEQ